ncbi:McrC family protein [Herbaspirillum sp. alder98]|uniref:McrC family protein n=1 Tax=Herbaspirillum sp. alder98 TaxID=2913096 RepID=UPI001CD8A955|nr:McrC family protein [Herbaspirillum sp. alder98]MCA1323746.1 McrC family protein [Herbaspirillum sp. alder98]
MRDLYLREFGLLVQGSIEGNSVDVCGISSDEAWSFLEALAYSDEKNDRFIEVARYGGRKALRVKNFIGVIAAPDGTQIEILPKTSEDAQDIGDTRELLWKMLDAVEDLKLLETTDANLMLRTMPLTEALASIFLKQVGALVRKGIRRDYERVQDEEQFLRGRLQVMRQIMQSPGRQHLFRIEYDLFSDNRAENRLIHAALVKVAASCNAPQNQRWARELRHGFESVPLSYDYPSDFAQWKTDRAMIHYQALLPWLRLILNQQCPFSLKDSHRGISFLFPMETLFEKYVTEMLGRQLASGDVRLHKQVRSRYLSDAPQAFQLKPDLALKKDQQWLRVMDTKWKLIDSAAVYADGKEDLKAGISQADVYQLFAYGHKYMNGKGRLVLIYPRWSGFSEPLKEFRLGEGLFLDVIPFDLKSDGSRFVDLLLTPSLDGRGLIAAAPLSPTGSTNTAPG